MMLNGICHSKIPSSIGFKNSMTTRIKFCGFSRKEDVLAAVQLDVHALGFVFYPSSPRCVSAEQARELIMLVPPFITTVGLFVNATQEQVVETISVAPVNVLQFHGDETPDECHRIAQAVQRPYICALRVKPGMRADDLLEYEAKHKVRSPWFRALLLDTFVDSVVNSFGGTGKVFDWSIIPKELAPRVVLSGGLSVQNATDAVACVRPYAVDISSGVELSKGIKDQLKVQAFINAVRLADQAP